MKAISRKSSLTQAMVDDCLAGRGSPALVWVGGTNGSAYPVARRSILQAEMQKLFSDGLSLFNKRQLVREALWLKRVRCSVCHVLGFVGGLFTCEGINSSTWLLLFWKIVSVHRRFSEWDRDNVCFVVTLGDVIGIELAGWWVSRWLSC
jgi:hypothetical protein